MQMCGVVLRQCRVLHRGPPETKRRHDTSKVVGGSFEVDVRRHRVWWRRYILAVRILPHFEMPRARALARALVHTLAKTSTSRKVDCVLFSLPPTSFFFMMLRSPKNKVASREQRSNPSLTT